MRRYGRVALGGTFDRFHVGHEALLGTAFQLGRSVAIGLTSRRFLKDHPKPAREAIAPEAVRRRVLARWLARRYPTKRWTVVPLHDRFGRSVEVGIDALVVSADTAEGGRAVNRERRRRGLRPVPLVVVPLVLADDLEPVSSRRIRAGEIDRWGHRTSPLEVGLVAGTVSDLRASTRAIRAAFPRARVRSSPYRGRRPQSAARLRALAARAARPAGLGIAVSARPSTGWLVAVQGPHGRLDPRPVTGSSPRALEQGLFRFLRPAA